VGSASRGLLRVLACGPARRLGYRRLRAISRLAECIEETLADNRNAPFPATLVGHVGDGNFHCIYVINPENEAELVEANRLAGRMATRALARGGTAPESMALATAR